MIKYEQLAYVQGAERMRQAIIRMIEEQSGKIDETNSVGTWGAIMKPTYQQMAETIRYIKLPPYEPTKEQQL